MKAREKQLSNIRRKMAVYSIEFAWIKAKHHWFKRKKYLEKQKRIKEKKRAKFIYGYDFKTRSVFK
jgi:hypothetical protein